MPVYPRDMRGHGPLPPDPKWPGGARIAVQFVVNYEEGGENCLLHGDAASEAFLSEIVGAQAWPGQRHWNMESIYEYGARAGFWRLHRLFTDAEIPVTVYGVASALARGPEQVRAMQDADWEIASHGLKWIDYKDIGEDQERADMAEAVRLHTEVTGKRPLGWYLGRCSMNTVRLAAEEGGFDYIADSYADDLPYWFEAGGRDQLIVPYTLDANDMRFATPQGFNTGEDFYIYLKDSFDALYAEGAAGRAKMLSIGLHCRLAGRPGRAQGLKRFIDYAKGHENVWFARRIDIAGHWRRTFPPVRGERPGAMNREAFIARFGEVFEHSPWAAERAFDAERGPAHDSWAGMHSLMVRVFRAASRDERLGVLKAHPEPAGGAALNAEDSAAFESLNKDYRQKHGFPFIIAVRDYDSAGILAAFRARAANDRETEFAEACRQAERIAELRLRDMLDK